MGTRCVDAVPIAIAAHPRLTQARGTGTLIYSSCAIEDMGEEFDYASNEFARAFVAAGSDGYRAVVESELGKGRSVISPPRIDRVMKRLGCEPRGDGVYETPGGYTPTRISFQWAQGDPYATDPERGQMTLRVEGYSDSSFLAKRELDWQTELHRQIVASLGPETVEQIEPALWLEMDVKLAWPQEDYSVAGRGGSTFDQFSVC